VKYGTAAEIAKEVENRQSIADDETARLAVALTAIPEPAAHVASDEGRALVLSEDALYIIDVKQFHVRQRPLEDPKPFVEVAFEVGECAPYEHGGGGVYPTEWTLDLTEGHP
jgi:anti-sigma factor RsiW